MAIPAPVLQSTDDKKQASVQLPFQPRALHATGRRRLLRCQYGSCLPLERDPNAFASGGAVLGFSQTGDDARFARQVIDRFTTFAKTGNPNHQPSVHFGVEITNLDVMEIEWLSYGQLNAMLDMNVKSRMAYHLQSASCQWIENDLKADFMFRVPS